ncbi:deoxyuridine 5'-triphosphate nucleotidohydrolase [Thalassoporum mexicanum PCC 7367]|uniref:deoxyuridine 5'-triphosphate nucleotidohydrolase n=1 Tax=Thalassoporum mexicanum TaxID=3457544 RepID=UPI00029FDAC4|nr:deoxyuridine 5'-triphosphate nucleotidohydrolase [Pseudanabaena sp. PCC 7367]AFY71200.1 deoxyuridine 5'-triphosphate nucleotidohydrolase [Pseudanabaena sp. PCC 7367]
MINLYIKPANAAVKQLYENHDFNHLGDAGFDLLMPEKVEFGQHSGSDLIKLIGFQISIYAEDAQGDPIGLFLTPRSSIYKTPFRQVNSPGVIDAGYRGEIKVPIEVTPNYLNKVASLLRPSLDLSKSEREQSDVAKKQAALPEPFSSPYISEDSTPIIPKLARLFQLVDPHLKGFKVEIVDRLPDSARSSDGFGSTGI